MDVVNGTTVKIPDDFVCGEGFEILTADDKFDDVARSQGCVPDGACQGEFLADIIDLNGDLVAGFQIVGFCQGGCDIDLTLWDGFQNAVIGEELVLSKTFVTLEEKGSAFDWLNIRFQNDIVLCHDHDCFGRVAVNG